ncbi:MAG: hypothetical protein AAF684_01215 [Pseudomonadota bacterium]
MTSSEWAIVMEAFPVVAAVGGVLYCVAAPLFVRARSIATQRKREAQRDDIRASEAAARVLQRRRMRERYPDDDARIFTAS